MRVAGATDPACLCVASPAVHRTAAQFCIHSAEADNQSEVGHGAMALAKLILEMSMLARSGKQFQNAFSSAPDPESFGPTLLWLGCAVGALRKCVMWTYRSRVAAHFEISTLDSLPHSEKAETCCRAGSGSARKEFRSDTGTLSQARESLLTPPDLPISTHHLPYPSSHTSLSQPVIRRKDGRIMPSTLASP